MQVELDKYAGFKTPRLEVKKVYDGKEDYEATDKFNKFMIEVHRDYSVKEKRSLLSAQKLVLTD